MEILYKVYIKETYDVLGMPNVLTMYQQTKVSVAGVGNSLQPWWDKLYYLIDR